MNGNGKLVVIVALFISGVDDRDPSFSLFAIS